MTRRRNLVIAATGLAAAAAGAYVLFARPSPSSREPVVAPPLADAGPADARPPRCAELGRDVAPARSFDLGGRTLAVQHGTLTIGRAANDDSVTILGVIADARGAEQDTVANMQRVASLFAEANVDLVLVLGGMATSSADLVRLLRPLTDTAPWPIVLVPGDRESVDATTTSVAELGSSVFDGSVVRFIDLDGVRIGTLPGVEFAERAVAGEAGCLRAPEDTEAMVATLSAARAATILASYSPPRQRGLSGTDRAVDGTHVGDMHLAAALEKHPPGLVLHAQIAPGRDQPTRGSSTVASAIATAASASASAIVATGAIDAVPLRSGFGTTTGSALIVRVETAKPATKFTWRRLRFLDGIEQP